MRRILTLCTTALLLIANSAQAYNSYQSAFAGSYSIAENDDSKVKGFGTTFVHYLEPITIKSSPHALQTFLQPTSNLALRLSQTSREYDGNYVESDSEDLAFRGTHYFNQQNTTLFASLLLVKEETDYDFTPRTGEPVAEETVYGVKFGTYLNPQTTIDFEYRYADLDWLKRETRKRKIYSLSYKQAAKLTNGDWMLVDVTFVKRDADSGSSDSTVADLDISYFFNQAFSLSVGYGVVNAESPSSDSNAARLDLKHYLNPNFALSFGAVRLDIDRESDDVEVFGFSIIYQI